MEQLKLRIETLLSCGIVDEKGAQDLYRIVEILQKNGVEPCDDTVGVLVTHVAAAMQRRAAGEQVTPLDPDVFAQVKEIAEYDRALRIRGEIVNAMQTPLSAEEQDFVLVHVGNILESV